MNKGIIIKEARIYVGKKLSSDITGHDYHHVDRISKLAKFIAKREKKGDLFLIEIAALFHDIADWKFTGGDESVGPRLARQFLEKHKVPEEITSEVEFIIRHISYKGGTNKVKMRTIEGMIVQDADRLDSLGAIGIGKAFAYGGFKGRLMYDPKIKPRKYKDLKSYANAKNTTLNHFYEKLFLISGMMNTKTAKQIAKKREKIQKDFVKEFLNEWEVKI